MPVPAGLSSPRVVIVGGGIGGLAAAYRIVRDLPGARVSVLDAGDRPGGKLRLAEVAGHQVDVGAESMLARRPEGVDLVEELGAGGQLVAPATTAASVWTRGALHPLPRATLAGIPADPDSTRGILTEGEVTRLRGERAWPGGPLTQDVSVGEYVGARLGPAVVDRLVEPLLGGVYAGHARRLSLQATMPVVWDAAMSGESLLALAGRSTGGTGRPPFAGVTGGVGRLPELLLGVLGVIGARTVAVRSSVIVRGLIRTPTGWALTVGPTSAEELVEADAVVLAVGPAPTARLLAGHAPAAAAILGAMETASSVVVTLAVGKEALGELPGSGFLVPPAEGRVVKASTFSGAKWAWTGALSRDAAYLRASIGRAGAVRDLQREDAELVEIAVREVGEALGRPLPRVLDAHVQRWGGGLPQYLVGHVERVARVREDVDRLPGVEVAGAAYEGVGIPAVIASATRAAAAVVTHLRDSPRVAGQ